MPPLEAWNDASKPEKKKLDESPNLNIKLTKLEVRIDDHFLLIIREIQREIFGMADINLTDMSDTLSAKTKFSQNSILHFHHS